jgi:hypothetical protein
MGAGEFAERHGYRVCDERSHDVAEDYAGACDFESGGGSQKESRSNGSADSDHGHLSSGELVMQSLFVNVFVNFVRRAEKRHWGTISNEEISGQWSVASENLEFSGH